MWWRGLAEVQTEHQNGEERDFSSDREVQHSEPVKLSTQLYQKKIYYLKIFKAVHAVALKMNNTFQSVVIHYSCRFHIWFAIISIWTKISEECFQQLIKAVLKAKGVPKWPVSVFQIVPGNFGGKAASVFVCSMHRSLIYCEMLKHPPLQHFSTPPFDYSRPHPPPSL